jgi:hypothetical protein
LPFFIFNTNKHFKHYFTNKIISNIAVKNKNITT